MTSARSPVWRKCSGRTSSAFPTKNSVLAQPFKAALALAFSIADCGGNDFRAVYLVGLPGQEQGNRADSAVQVPDSFHAG